MNEIILVDDKNVNLAKLRYLEYASKPDERTFDKMCRELGFVNIEMIRSIAIDDDWETERKKYIEKRLNEMNLESNFAQKKNQLEISALSMSLFKVSYNRLIHMINDGDYTPTIREVTDLMNAIQKNDLGKSSVENVNHFNNSKTLNVVFEKPIEQMTIEEIEASQKAIRGAINERNN